MKISDVKKLYRCYRLNNGEILIGISKELTETADGVPLAYIITRPMRLNMVTIEDDPNMAQIVLTNFIPFSDDMDYTISANAVICVAGIDKTISQYYSDALVKDSNDRKHSRSKPKETDTDFDVEFTPDEDADYTEETFESGNEGEVTEIHPLLRTMSVTTEKIVKN